MWISGFNKIEMYRYRIESVALDEHGGGFSRMQAFLARRREPIFPERFGGATNSISLTDTCAILETPY